MKTKFVDPLQVIEKSRNSPMFTSNRIYLSYFNQLSEYAMNRFEWINLPETCDERYLETCLFTKGYSLFFKDEILGYLSLSGTIGGQWNVYNIPTEREAIASNGYHKKLTINDSVIIYNNYNRTPTIYLCQQYAYLLYQIDSAMRINLNAQKTPIVLKANKNQKLTFENLQLEYEANVPVLRVTEDFNMKNFDVLKLDAPFICDDLLTLKQNIWDEALISLGYERTYTRKNERENQIESASSSRQAIGARFIYLNERKNACKKINAMYGLDLDVKFREGDIFENGYLYNYYPDNSGERKGNSSE